MFPRRVERVDELTYLQEEDFAMQWVNRLEMLFVAAVVFLFVAN